MSLEGAEMSLQQLGGRCYEDGQQYWWSMGHQVKESFDINCVPHEMANEYAEIEQEMTKLTIRMFDFIEKYKDHLG